MKLSQVKSALAHIKHLEFLLPDGSPVAAHFHVTEVGEIDRRYVDCGGKMRRERVVNFQLWEAGDFEHRLSPEKFLDIIHLSEERLALEDAEVEVEYQSNTIGRFGLTFQDNRFLLTAKQTDCLAQDKCGIPAPKQKIPLSSITGSCCTPGSNCC